MGLFLCLTFKNNIGRITLQVFRMLVIQCLWSYDRTAL